MFLSSPTPARTIVGGDGCWFGMAGQARVVLVAVAGCPGNAARIPPLEEDGRAPLQFRERRTSFFLPLSAGAASAAALPVGCGELGCTPPPPRRLSSPCL